MALTPLLLLLFLVFVVVFFLCAVAVRAGVSGSVAVVDFRVAALAFCCVLSLFMVLFLLLCCLFFCPGYTISILSHAAIFAPRTDSLTRRSLRQGPEPPGLQLPRPKPQCNQSTTGSLQLPRPKPQCNQFTTGSNVPEGG